MATEIERKFLLNYIPDNLKVEKRKIIYQSYLATGKEEVRIRKVSYENLENEFFLTYKNRLENKIGREEIEIEIGENTYNQLNNKSLPVIKERIVIGLQDGLYAEVDIFKNVGFELRTVEVEFKSYEEEKNFTPPKWFGRELTGSKEYNNQALWMRVNNMEQEDHQ